MAEQNAAIRAVAVGIEDREGIVEATVARARELAVAGWVRTGNDGSLLVHAEGDRRSVEELLDFVSRGASSSGRAAVTSEPARVEGHEQFAVRGVSAGVFVVQEHAATAHHFDLRLEVGAVMRSWSLPKGPSLDPSIKRLAVEVADHAKQNTPFEGLRDGSGVIVWDRGSYEQGGRVAWPQALARGHAVFVLHGEKLSGGFALQRTRAGDKPQWLLIKRRDEFARPGSDVVTELPRSVISGRTLAEIVA